MNKPLTTESKLLIVGLLVYSYFHFNPIQIDTDTSLGRGMKIMIAHNLGDPGQKLNYDQLIDIDSKEVRDFAFDNCLKMSDQSVAFRTYNTQQDISKEDEMWQKMMKRPRDSLPWIYGDNGSKHLSEPVSKDGHLLDQLKKLK